MFGRDLPTTAPDIIRIRNDPPLYCISCFSLELAIGCATHTSRYCLHPKRSTTLCLSSLWSLDRPRHANLQILSTSETIHHSISRFSLELATGCATPTSRYYQQPKRSTTLCLPSLWSLRRAAPRPLPDYRKSYLSISSHVPPISPQFRQTLQEREREGGKSLYNTGKRRVLLNVTVFAHHF